MRFNDFTRILRNSEKGMCCSIGIKFASYSLYPYGSILEKIADFAGQPGSIIPRRSFDGLECMHTRQNTILISDEIQQTLKENECHESKAKILFGVEWFFQMVWNDIQLHFLKIISIWQNKVLKWNINFKTFSDSDRNRETFKITNHRFRST